MTAFSFDVTVSDHDSLKEGVTERRLFGAQTAHHRVTVAAEDIVEASLIAAQIARCTCGYVTGVYPRL